ncbi:uncharacterized protein [Rutidosis leptorrhynchoides]|uniref:uncharacterized protein n=1 Tax=Rutidosis leptorrhynchoides TaxID=125765 RepID=UPI003A990755
MAQNKAPSTSAIETKTYVFLNELELGKQSQVQVMICRSWDTHTIYGKYLGTEFIASDEQGNIIQLTAKSNVAHHFISRLKDGFVYLLTNFDVISNRDDYRILKDNALMIELNGSTLLRKQPTTDTSPFIRHPFNCIQIEDLQPTLGKFVVDPLPPGESARAILEFDLENERGKTIRTTLWGDLGDYFLKRKPAAPAYYYIILSYVVVKKEFNGVLSLSSTSSTIIIDNAEIPALIDFKERMSGVQLPIAVEPSAPGWKLSPPKDGTLRELLDMACKGKKNIWRFKTSALKTFGTTTLAASAKQERASIGGLASIGANPVTTTFRVICNDRDEIAAKVMVLFDETAEPVTQTTSKALLAEVDEVRSNIFFNNLAVCCKPTYASHCMQETCNTVLPNALANLLGTTRVVLLKAMSYYDQGTYESFNCIKVYAPDLVQANPPPPTTSDPTMAT